MQHEWSLEGKVKEYYNEDDKGNFIIRVCQNCFSTFEKSNICPYCGAEYEITPIEIENFKQIELKKIEEEKEIKRQRYLNNIKEKVKEYKSAKECKNWVELTQFVKEKGYRPRLCVCVSETNEDTISEKEKKMKIDEKEALKKISEMESLLTKFSRDFKFEYDFKITKAGLSIDGEYQRIDIKVYKELN